MATGEETIGTILLIRPSAQDRTTLQNILENSRWTVAEVNDCREAQAFLAENRVHLVFYNCDETAADWRDFARQITGLEQAPVLIAASRLADDSLWAETLNLGGFDLLASPLDSDEARRTIFSAWQRWESARRGRSDFLQNLRLPDAKHELSGIKGMRA